VIPLNTFLHTLVVLEKKFVHRSALPDQSYAGSPGGVYSRQDIIAAFWFGGKNI
jgi:hypothetical protein